MKKLMCSLLTLAAITTSWPTAVAAQADLKLSSQYTETISDTTLKMDAVKDFGVKSDSKADQSAALQSAIDQIAAKGGGSLIIPKGTYHFFDVYIASNVHILVDKDAILKPYVESADGGEVMLQFTNRDENSPEYVENCSIRCIQEGEHFTVDYSFLKPNAKARFIVASMVKNFYIADASIKDNYTKYCGIIFVPTHADGADKWAISRPTFGEIRNCRIYKGSTGYGLCQLHGAQTLYFENIYSNGGVTLRLESGAGGPWAGVFDISAKDVVTENGRAAVMMNPHATVNGTVKIDGVLSKGSGIAVLVHGGFVDRKHAHIADAKPGIYASDSEIVNIKAIYGQQGQIDEKQIFACEPDPKEYAKFKMNDYGDTKSFIGPSIMPVFDCTNGNYKVTYQNISSEGFSKSYTEPVYEHSIADRKKKNGAIIEALPAMQNLSAADRKAYDQTKAAKAADQKAKLESFKSKAEKGSAKVEKATKTKKAKNK